MDGEIRNLTRVWLTAIASLCYCCLISARLSKGKWRLISLIPVFYIFAILPLCTTSAFFTALTAFFFTWLANFKLLLFAFDRGPIASDFPKSLPVFIAIAALPFKMKPKSNSPAPKKLKKLPLYLTTEIPIAAVLISILHEYKEQMHPYFLMAEYCCLIFLLIEIVIELSSMLVRFSIGLELEPASDEPYLSTSLQEFWGRRWNLTVNGILREAVYRPVRAAAAARRRDLAALLGVLAAFLVSGLMHELLFWYVYRGSRPSWEMTMFFVVHGVCVAVEFGVKAVLADKKWRLPWFVAGPLTVGFVVGTSFWLFFPPLMRNGADVRVVEEMGFLLGVLEEKIKGVWLLICEKWG